MRTTIGRFGALRIARDAIRQPNRPFRRIMRDGRRFMRRDAVIPINGSVGNVLPGPNPFSSFGWLGQVIGDMGNSARWAGTLNPDNNLVVANGSPLESLATSPNALLNACMIACAGAGNKVTGAAQWPSQATVTPQVINLTQTGNTAFGVYIRISNSLTNFKFATYEVQLWNGAPTASTATSSSVLIEVTSLPVELVLLSISNAAGKGTIVGNTSPQVYFPSSSTAGSIGNVNYSTFTPNGTSSNVGDVFYAETLNMRDIGNIVTALAAGAISM